MDYQKGSGIMADISTLALPLGLARVATSNLLKNEESSESKSENSKSQIPKNSYGGAFAENILIEAGLSVVPFALISSLEYFDKNDKKSNSNPEKKINKN